MRKKCWYADSDNTVKVVGLKDKRTGAYVNAATITASLFKATPLNPLGVAVDKGGGLVGIPVTAHGLTSGVDFIRFTDSLGYDAQYDVHADTTANEIVITATFAEETFTGTESIYIGITNAKSVSLAYLSGTDGDYAGKFPKTAIIVTGQDYEAFGVAVSGGDEVLFRILRPAAYKGF